MSSSYKYDLSEKISTVVLIFLVLGSLGWLVFGGGMDVVRSLLVADPPTTAQQIPTLIPQALTLDANKKTLTASAISPMAVFDAWLTEAKSTFAKFDAGSQSIVDDYHCQNQEIGDGMLTEPACTGFRILPVGKKQITVHADWSISSPERWHADMMLDTPIRVECQEIQSSIEYHRAKNTAAELVACQVRDGSEVLIILTSANVDIAYLSPKFMQAYPGYVSRLIQQVETSP